MSREYKIIKGVKLLRCSKCGAFKPLTDKYFKPCPRTGGYLASCRVCVAEYQRKYQIKKTGIVPKKREPLGPEFKNEPIPSICPYCGKKHKITKDYCYLGTLPARLFCERCLNKFRRRNLQEAEE